MDENDLKIVRITNISNFDFTGELGARYHGRDFVIPTGGSLLVPLTVGKHLAKHLARQILIKKAPIRDKKEKDGKGSDLPLWNEESIMSLVKKILADVYEEEAPLILSEEDKLAKRVADLNKVTEEMDVEEGNNVPDIVPTETDNPKNIYKDKAQVIAELSKRGIKFNARETKNNLLQLLK